MCRTYLMASFLMMLWSASCLVVRCTDRTGMSAVRDQMWRLWTLTWRI